MTPEQVAQSRIELAQAATTKAEKDLLTASLRYADAQTHYRHTELGFHTAVDAINRAERELREAHNAAPKPR